jgi:exodeoxyribonuclease VII small subunit
MTQDTVSPEDLTFGAALGELEQIVKALESGQLELEDSLERYERGVALLRVCQEKLAHAEQRVTMLIGELEGEAAPATDAAAESEGGSGDE